MDQQPLDKPLPYEPTEQTDGLPEKPTVFKEQHRHYAMLGMFAALFVLLIGGTVFAFSRGIIVLPFTKKQVATNTTTANTSPTNTVAVTNTETSSNTSANTNISDTTVADMGLAACYVNKHPDVLKEMPKNDLTDSYQDYVKATWTDIGCDKLDAAAIEAAKPLLVTDADHDGVTLVSEELLGTSDTKADSDGNGVNDFQEFSDLANADTTSNVNASNSQVDTDGDTVSDSFETTQFHTDPKVADTDADGLSDYEEVSGYITNPLKSDSDGDGFLDGDEVCHGYNPLGAGTYTSPLMYPPAACPPNLTPANTLRPEPKNKTVMTIDGLQATSANGHATVTWTTKQGAYAAVYFGKTSTYDSGRYPDSLARLTSHTASFPVTAGTTYHYAVLSCPDGIFYLSECAVSADHTVIGK